MILTTSEVKSYLGITSTEYDSQIDAYLYPSLYDAFDYMNNYFHNNNVKVTSHNLTFSTAGTIVMSDNNFSTFSFQSGDEIHIVNSARNDGIYTATTVSSATITISTTQTLKSETEETETIIVKMDVPQSLKPIISAMIKHKIDNPYGTYKSESLGDYSYSGNGGTYPDGLMAALDKYRRIQFV